MSDEPSIVTTNTLRKWITVAIGLAIVGAVVFWYLTRDTLPGVIVIATGERGGEYFRFAQALEQPLSRRTGGRIVIRTTHGSKDNLSSISRGAAQLAIVQSGSVSMDELDVVAPLYPELVHFIVRRGSGIQSIADLANKRVSLGVPGSGMRQSAVQVLEHYGIQSNSLVDNDVYFMELENDKTYDAAIVTTGIGNRDLDHLLRSGDFELLSITDAKALDLRSPYFRYYEIPSGLYAEQPAVPSTTVRTVATTAFLVTRKNGSNLLVDHVLASLYEEDLKLLAPTLIPRQEASDWVSVRLHPKAKDWIAPRDKLGWVANVMESLAATKELLFALGAGLYLFWLRWRTRRERERLAMLRQQKDHLDMFLVETLTIEEAQMHVTDTEKLQSMLDQITRIKLRALREFTEEALRSDQAFAIFLGQCSSLINKIQLKIVTYSRSDE